MKLIKKLGVAAFLTLGYAFLTISVAKSLDHNKTQKDVDTAIGGLVAGVPCTVAGSWLIWSLIKQHRKKTSDSLRSTFYRLILQGNGSVNLLRFAMEANLSGTVARQYLDKCAKEFGAYFDVSPEGSIIYHFDSAINSAAPLTISSEAEKHSQKKLPPKTKV